MKMKRTKQCIIMFIGILLGFCLVVCVPSQAYIPDTEDYYIWEYQWTNDYRLRHESVVSWNVVRGSNTGTTKSTANTPPFRVWTSESRGKYQIDRSLCQLDLTNLTSFWGISQIKFYITVSSFNDNNNNAQLIVTNGTSFQYNNLNDYDYLRHYFIDAVTFRSPFTALSLTGTGSFTAIMLCDKGFSAYARAKPVNISFTHGDDKSNTAPAIGDDNYIEFNVTKIEVFLLPLGGFPSAGSKWALLSIPVNAIINKNDLRLINSLNNYTWSQAVSNNVIADWVYGWNITDQRYYLADNINGSYGYWFCLLEQDYNFWHTNFTVATAICDYTDYLFIAGLDLEPPLIVLSLFFLLFYIGNEKEDALLLILAGVILFALSIYYIAEFTLISEIVAVAMIGASLYSLALGIHYARNIRK